MDGTWRAPGSPTVDSGRVHVGIRTDRPLETAWLALRDPVRLARWFGELDRPWQEGRSARIDFGDGDYFTIDTREVIEHRRIGFDWRFLGLGPPARIRWSTTAVPDGTLVVVDDEAADRSSAEADQLLAGWTDFFDRLAGHLSTGESTRYGFRDEIDGSVALPSGAGGVLDPDRIGEWLPIATDGFGPRWFFVVDEDGPRRFRMHNWAWSPSLVTFQVAIPEAAAPTSCVVALQRVGSTTGLTFRHAGWRALGLPDRRVLLLRRRFTASWVAALTRAAEPRSGRLAG